MDTNLPKKTCVTPLYSTITREQGKIGSDFNSVEEWRYFKDWFETNVTSIVFIKLLIFLKYTGLYSMYDGSGYLISFNQTTTKEQFI